MNLVLIARISSQSFLSQETLPTHLCAQNGRIYTPGYDQICCPASPKLLLGLDLGLGCHNKGFKDHKSNLLTRICNENESKQHVNAIKESDVC